MSFIVEPNESDILIFDKEYHCWRDGDYIGVATYVDDVNVGPSLISMSISPDGELIHEVYIPTKYKLV